MALIFKNKYQGRTQDFSSGEGGLKSPEVQVTIKIVKQKNYEEYV